MIIADTNVLSEPLRERPDRRVLSWLLAHESQLGITAITLAELRYGIERLSEGERKRGLTREIDVLVQSADDRIVGFDRAAAEEYAKLRASREAVGRTVSVEDTMIAAICMSRGYALATRNVDDFADTGIPLIDPW